MSQKKRGEFVISSEGTKEKQVPVYVNNKGLSVEITPGHKGYKFYIAHELGAPEAATLFNAIADYTENGGLKAITIKFPYTYEDPEEDWINKQSPTIHLRFGPLSDRLAELAEAALLPDEVLQQSHESFLTNPQSLEPKTGENETTLTFRWRPQQANYRCVLSTKGDTYQFTAYKSNWGSQDGEEEILFSLTFPHQVNVQQLERVLQNPQRTPESLSLITYNGPKAEY